MRHKKGLRDSLADALRIADHIHRHPDDFRGDAVIVPLRMLAKGRRGGLTPGRWRVLDAIRTRGPFDTLEALAKDLDRPMARVSQDVQALEQFDLVHSSRRGKTKRLSADSRPIFVA